ncbi:MAG TPA: hypothetical protein VFZ65_12845 [Planctomycetota bacterium]|nr:hypothetical protein [Planctomycetota bacterium]
MNPKPPARAISRQSTLLIVLTALAALAALVLLLFWAANDDAPRTGAPREQPRTAAHAATAVAAPADAERKVVAETPAQVPKPTPAAAPAPGEPADLEARDWLTVRVIDAYHEPIPTAKVRILGLRKQGDAGAWYGMRGGETTASTDAEGRARIDYTRWVDIDGKADHVDLAVSHPDFIAFRDSSFELRAEECTVQLQKGATVRLWAWYRTRSLVVRDIEISMDWQSKLGNGGWQRDPDGSCSTTRLSPGPHFVAVKHTSQELGSLASRFVLFVLGEQRLLDVDVELRPLVTLRGRLDPAVPRPIVDGHVWVNLHTIQGAVSQSDDYEAAVAADGTFTVPGLREGPGQVIAWCRGWVSRRIVPRTFADLAQTVPDEATAEDRQSMLEQAQAYEHIAQPIADSSTQDLVVAMERTGILEVCVTDEQGGALPGVRIETWPNVQWRGVGSTVFPWGTWHADSDAKGVARVADLPPDDSLFLGVQSETYRLRKAERDETPTAVIESGNTTRRALVLERIPK